MPGVAVPGKPWHNYYLSTSIARPSEFPAASKEKEKGSVLGRVAYAAPVWAPVGAPAARREEHTSSHTHRQASFRLGKSASG